MTKLDAVCEVLRAVGLGGVAALDPTGASNATFAERLLDEVELQVQSDGWSYNTRRSVTLSPVTGGTITAISLANPTVITCADHGLLSGQTVTIAGSNSTPTVNGDRVVTVLTASTFTVPVNVTVAGTTATWTTEDAFIPLPAGVITIEPDGRDSWRNITQLGRHLYDQDDNTDAFSADLLVQYLLRYDFDCIPQPIQKYIAAWAGERYNDRYGVPARKGTLMRDTAVAKAAALKFDDGASQTNLLNSSDLFAAKGSRIQYRR